MMLPFRDYATWGEFHDDAMEWKTTYNGDEVSELQLRSGSMLHRVVDSAADPTLKSPLGDYLLDAADPTFVVPTIDRGVSHHSFQFNQLRRLHSNHLALAMIAALRNAHSTYDDKAAVKAYKDAFSAGTGALSTLIGGLQPPRVCAVTDGRSGMPCPQDDCDEKECLTFEHDSSHGNRLHYSLRLGHRMLLSDLHMVARCQHPAGGRWLVCPVLLKAAASDLDFSVFDPPADQDRLTARLDEILLDEAVDSVRFSITHRERSSGLPRLYMMLELLDSIRTRPLQPDGDGRTRLLTREETVALRFVLDSGDIEDDDVYRELVELPRRVVIVAGDSSGSAVGPEKDRSSKLADLVRLGERLKREGRLTSEMAAHWGAVLHILRSGGKGMRLLEARGSLVAMLEGLSPEVARAFLVAGENSPASALVSVLMPNKRLKLRSAESLPFSSSVGLQGLRYPKRPWGAELGLAVVRSTRASFDVDHTQKHTLLAANLWRVVQVQLAMEHEASVYPCPQVCVWFIHGNHSLNLTKLVTGRSADVNAKNEAAELTSRVSAALKVVLVNELDFSYHAGGDGEPKDAYIRSLGVGALLLMVSDPDDLRRALSHCFKALRRSSYSPSVVCAVITTSSQSSGVRACRVRH